MGRTVRALAFVAALMPAAVWAQQDSAAARHAPPPSPIDGYAITESKVFPDSSQGTLFRYTKAGQPLIDVFVYPYAAPTAPLAAAMGEATTFQASLPALQQKGFFESYKVAFTTTDTTHVGTGVVLGSLVAVALKRRGQVVVTFQYVYGLRDDMLKARVDMTQAQLAHTDARVFVHDLVARLAAGTPN
jgi:hypothetical protein